MEGGSPDPQASITLAVLVKQGDYVSDLSCVGDCGLELVEELDTIALSLASRSAKRSSSFLSRSSSFLSSSSSFCICSSLCSIAYRCTFKSTVGCKLAVLWPSPGRQRCKELLLAAVDRWKRFPGGRHGYSRCRRSRPEAIGCDPRQQDGGKGREPSLPVKQHHRSQLWLGPAWCKRPGTGIRETTEFRRNTLKQPRFIHRLV